MSQVSGVSSVPPEEQVTQTAGVQGAAGDSSSIIPGGTIDSLPPEVTNAIMQGIAMQICNQMQHSTNRMREILKEYEKRR